MLSLLSNFLSSKKTFIGVSIGSSSVKIVELLKEGKELKLLHFGIIQLPQDAVLNREIVDQNAVELSIKNLVNEIKIINKNVCVGISGNSLMIKRMVLEVENNQDIKDQIFWEAEQYLPFDISEVNMDYQIITRSKEGKTDIILVTAKKSIIDSYISCVESANLKVKVIDVDFFALQNVYEFNYKINNSEAVALVDIGASATKIVVVSEGIPVFTKDIAMGGNNLTAEIQKSLGLSYVDAESLKISGGPDGSMPNEVSELMNIAAENFTSEIKKSLDFYSASTTGPTVAYILLCGGSAKISGLSKMIEDSVGLPTQIINPFNSISYDSKIFNSDYLNQIAPIASIPIGLAIRMGAE